MDAPEVADDSGSYYAILGVAPSATDEEVRRAYRTLAASLHPDKAQDPDRRQDAAELFSVIQEAYEVRGEEGGRVESGLCERALIVGTAENHRSPHHHHHHVTPRF